MFFKYFLVLFFPFVILNAQYQDFHFHHITTYDGLSNSTVTCVVQDDIGFIWIGTFNGLNRFDGRDFTIYLYNQNDPHSISDNYVSSIIEDHNKHLWVGTNDGLNYYNQDKDNFNNFRHIIDDTSSINDNQIQIIFEDSKNRLWIGTRNGGLDLFDRKNNRFIHHVHDPNDSVSISGNFIQSIFEDTEGNLWIGNRNGSIDILFKNDNKFSHLLYHNKALTNSAITSITESENENIWIGTQRNGLFKIKFIDQKIQNIFNYKYKPKSKKGLTGNIILSLMADWNDKLWIGTEDEGLNILNIKNGKFTYYKTDPLSYSSLNNNSIYTIYEDKARNIWLGTYAGGVNMLLAGKAYFGHYKHFPGNNNSLSDNMVNGFWEDENQNIWIATNENGIDVLNRKDKKFIHYNKKNSTLSANAILSLYGDSQHNLWIGSWANGLFKFNKKNRNFINFSKEKNGLGSNNVFKILEGKNGNLWLATFWGGLTYFNIKTHTSTVYDTRNSGLIDDDLRTITKDYNGVIWIGTDVGLASFNPKTKVFKSYKHYENDKSSISKGFVYTIFLAKDSTLWIGTTGGLNKFDRKTDSFVHYYKEEGLPSDEIMCIIQDDDGILWISTGKGISRFDPKLGIFKNYDNSDGLQDNEFNARSGFKTKSGKLIFGGNGGFNIVQPKNLIDNSYIPPVVITELRLFNKPVSIGVKDSPLEKNILETKNMKFSHDQSVISFSFVALNYISPEKNQYAYMMEGFDKDWNYIGSNHTATYTNLDPGNYVFRVKASNNDGIWNEKGTSIKIIIDPPFWETWWAYLIEIILCLLIAYMILNYFISRQRLKNKLKLEHIELEKMYELDQMKTRFFSNISHEFHSPMTLILNPLEKLINSMNIDEKVKSRISLVYKNVKRLQRMTNQLKDLNKMETGDLRLNLSKGNIIQFIKEISHSFYDYAKEHHITFQFKSCQEQKIAWFDPDKLDKIIYNLLSNAFKFTRDNGEIKLAVSIEDSTNEFNNSGENSEPSEKIEITVQDNGIGIPKDKIEYIFKREYRLENHNSLYSEGSGIGLAFVNELIKLYKGDISVESFVEKGTTFKIKIPLDERYLEENQLVSKFKTYVNSSHAAFNYAVNPSGDLAGVKKSKYKSKDAPVVLIVEDDREIREYMKNSLDINYRIHEAEDGLSGFYSALQIIPDIIITDIKMPGIDGIELCHRLKNDEKTSHIPIVMLTSYSSQEYLIKGLKSGADIYLTKPFNIDVLEAQMVNILEARKKLKEKYGKEIVLGPSKLPITDIDENFLNRLTKIIEDHISDNKFNADILSKEIGMSRMQLYRKLRGLTDKTVHEFIRDIRLKRAVQLLEQKKMTITEVAYEVGFNDLTYFARCFRKQYEKSPSEYRSNKS